MQPTLISNQNPARAQAGSVQASIMAVFNALDTSAAITLEEAETIQAPQRVLERRPDDDILAGYRVIIYDDDWHSMDEVVLQLQKATGCSLEKAAEIMFEAHTKGRAICYNGQRDECHRVARVLREIRLQVEVDCD